MIPLNKKSVCVFCSARNNLAQKYIDVAAQVGADLAKNNFNVVYGGGRVGLMGVVADSALAAQGTVTGVIPETLFSHEIAHNQVTELIKVKTMHERKAIMELRSDAFLVIPGGFGTMDEINEIITWRQLGLHKKPIAILNFDGFYTDYIKFVSNAVKEGFISPEHQEMLIISSSWSDLLDQLKKHL